MSKDQKMNTPNQQQIILVKRHRRQNRDGQLATTQTEIFPQPTSPQSISAVVATQTRATLPPYAIALANDPNHRQNYQIEYKNTSLAITPKPSRPAPKPGRLSQNAGIFSNPGAFDFEQSGQRRQQQRRGRLDEATSSSSIYTDMDPYGSQHQSYSDGDTFTQLVSAMDDMLVSEYQQREQARKGLPRGLECLYDVDHFFIQPGFAEDFADALVSLKNKYDVVDSRGQRIYYVGELWDATHNAKLCTVTPKFYLKLFDYKCTEVMTVEGKWGMAKLSLGSTVLGYVEEHWKLFKRFTDFVVKDESGEIVYYLMHEVGNEDSYSYEVYCKHKYEDMPEVMEPIGRISKLWNGIDVPEPSLAYSYGVNFPAETPADKKALLLSALFVLYFKFVADSFREIRAEKCAWFATVACCIGILLLIVGFSFLFAYIFSK